MNWADYLIVGIVGVSAVIALWRGFMREAISLASWVVAVWVALAYAGRLQTYLEPYIEVPSIRLGIAFALLLVVTLILGALLGVLMQKLVHSTGISGTDRVLGLVFGLGRGVLVVALIVLLAGLTPIPQDPWWQQSILIPHFEIVATRTRGLLPPEVAGLFGYE